MKMRPPLFAYATKRGFAVVMFALPSVKTAPLPDITVPRTGYVALVPFDADKTSPLKDFVDWLVAEGSAANR